MAEDQHLADTVKPREGFYRKEGDGQTKDYKSEWAGHSATAWSGGGYGKLLYQIHHIVPEDSIYNKAVDKMSNEEERKTVKTCMLRSKWNINEDANLVGLPDLYAFLIYFDRKKGNEKKDAVTNSGEGTYIRNKISRLNQRSKKADDYIKLESLFGELGDAGASPEKYPVHLPVSWGHTKYNYAVADDVTKKVINKVKKAAKEHKLDVTTVAPQFNQLSTKWKNYLKGRAGSATYETWKTRYDTPPAAESAWRTPFTMHDASSTIT